MIPFERQEKILDVLRENNLVKIDELLKYLDGVSMSTLRRDIKELEKSGKVESVYGGAVRYISDVDELPISKKSLINQKGKEKIATIASNLIVQGDSIYVDSGSNGTFLIEKIIEKSVTIYTTNTSILEHNFTDMKAKIIMIGGEYNPVTSSLTGPITEEVIRNLYFDKAFIGVNGVDINNGVTTPNLTEALKKRLIKSHSKKTYLLCDSSKFGVTANVRAFDIEDCTIISDKNNKELAEITKIMTS
ncbi:DeoR/GlpR family DNA-binding transcription regulator [Ligilactobacillus salivarius]|uniref:DeoR/GlpR family DNA-binding transcription regulator n=1 Tax=Ligilactobacillus salivarius TaxID=1624 RepID=UPI002673FE12|nr:DeoR/GlpR family DNA-binding transcription regulator [Ligilactobacillus salivarius]